MDGPASPDAEKVIVVIDRLVTLPQYRKRGWGKLTLNECLGDIMDMIRDAQAVAVHRISMFLPIKDVCFPAATTALRVGLASLQSRQFDPTGAVSNEYCGDSGVQEFSMRNDSALTGAI